MMQLDDQTPAWVNQELSSKLVELCAGGEGQHLEFKVQLPSQGHDIGKSLAAFASSGGGMMLYGVSDNGEIRGLDGAESSEKRDEIERRLLGAARDVKPPVPIRVQWAYHAGRVVCSVQITSGIEPVYYSNHRPMIRVGAISRPAEPTEVERQFRKHLGDRSSDVLPEATKQISARMRRVLALMGEARHEPLSVADLARAMSLHSPVDLDLVMAGSRAPSFSLIDAFCSRFSVNAEWLSTGRGEPFGRDVEYRPDPFDYYEVIERIKPEIVYLVRSTSPVGEASILVYEDHLNVYRIPRVWHVSDHVGGGGARDLLSLYRLFKRWSDTPKSYMVLGREVGPKLAKALFNDRVHPGIVEHMPLSHWWDDLTDLEGRWTTPRNSAKTYGETFVAAQEIIRRKLTDS